MPSSPIRAADYLPLIPRDRASLESSGPLVICDQILLALFGAVPDYNDGAMERLWWEIAATPEDDVIDYCLTKGLDILDDHGSLVPAWQDMAVMLKAVDRGLLLPA